ncbi:MAG TPA: enoyl-CoA hydratase-related protein, partial [Phenylobacterium sp.]|nr:enoyl-CoA hydratase-related protein [Phenylobacterium sp.]
MAAPTFETLLYAVEDGVATVTLNRPEKLNAFNTQMMNDMIAVFDETDRDDAVRCVIVTGAGRAFCAGADLSAGAQTFNYDARSAEDRAARQRDGVQRDGGGLLT